MLSNKLDPAARGVLEMMAGMGGPPLETLPVAEARALREGMLAMAGEPAPVAGVEDRVIPGPGGAPLTVRIYTPRGDTSARPAFVYFHGGGWVIGDLETHDNVCRELTRRSGAVGIAVEYRLSPEAKFPAGVEDCFAAAKWVADNAAKLGIDADRISVAGDSAGGNMATVVSMKCRDEAGPALALQILIYPWLDLGDVQTASRIEFKEEHFLTVTGLQWFAGHYLVNIEDVAHPHASPFRAENLRDLPPALIITAECDPLCGEGEAYGQRLKQAGVPVTYTRYRGMIHGFFSMMGAIPASYRAVDQVAAAIRIART